MKGKRREERKEEGKEQNKKRGKQRRKVKRQRNMKWGKTRQMEKGKLLEKLFSIYIAIAKKR
jgi:hypothetical protein